MKREEILALCRKAPDVGQVKHEDFIDYILVLEQPRKVGEEWVTVENAYMSVDGKIAMANEDHRRQGKKLDFEDPIILVDTEEQLTLMVCVTSEVYGRRHGIATSRRVGGTPTEREYAWEVAETSAIGRALTAMGYGVLPGAGLASAEDMMRALSKERVTPVREKRAEYKPPPAPPRKPRRMSRYQHQKLTEMYRQLHQVDEAAATEGVESLFQAAFQHGMDQATYDEAARITAQLLAETKKAEEIRESGNDRGDQTSCYHNIPSPSTPSATSATTLSWGARSSGKT